MLIFLITECLKYLLSSTVEMISLLLLVKWSTKVLIFHLNENSLHSGWSFIYLFFELYNRETKDKEHGVRYSRLNSLSSSLAPLCLSVASDVTTLCSPEPRHKAQRLLVPTLAWRHLQRSWNAIITTGDFLNNDSGHLLYSGTSKPPAGSVQGQLDMRPAQLLEITTFTLGLNYPPPVSSLP